MAIDQNTLQMLHREPEVPAAPDVIAEEPHPNDKFLKQWGIKPEAMQELKKIKRRKF